MKNQILSQEVIAALEDSLREYISAEVARQVAAATSGNTGATHKQNMPSKPIIGQVDRDYKDWLAELEAIDTEGSVLNGTASSSSRSATEYKSDKLDLDFADTIASSRTSISDYAAPAAPVEKPHATADSGGLKTNLNSLLSRVKKLRNGELI